MNEFSGAQLHTSALSMHTPSEGNGRGKNLKMLQIPGKKTVEARIHSDPLGEKCYARHACFRFQFYRLMIIE